MKDCVSCVHEYLSPMSDTCRECGIAMLNYEEAKPKTITNADRIRAMTDEGLADEILRWFNWLNAVEWDDKRIIGWLKQEVSTDG